MVPPPASEHVAFPRLEVHRLDTCVLRERLEERERILRQGAPLKPRPVAGPGDGPRGRRSREQLVEVQVLLRQGEPEGAEVERQLLRVAEALPALPARVRPRRGDAQARPVPCRPVCHRRRLQEELGHVPTRPHVEPAPP